MTSVRYLYYRKASLDTTGQKPNSLILPHGLVQALTTLLSDNVRHCKIELLHSLNISF